MKSIRESQDELITAIHLIKLRLVAKYGPGIVEIWSTQRSRNVA